MSSDLKGGDNMTKSRTSTEIRRAEIVHLVRDPNISVHDIAKKFEVSVSTVRRDLAVLVEEGEVIRTYGGAMQMDTLERSWHYKETAKVKEKEAIADAAAALVKPGDLVLLDAGTTVARVAQRLSNRTDISIVTNGLSSLFVLADANVPVHVLPGRLRRPNEAIIGSPTYEALSNLTPNIAFLGVDGVHPTKGLNCPDSEQATLKSAMAQHSLKAWVLADDSKLDAEPWFSYWFKIHSNTGLITNAPKSETNKFNGKFLTILNVSKK
jgi:DeoR/GlpR family transcriptional regulator of sugar metabolism